MYKSMGAKHSNWHLSQNNQYVSYALLSLEGSISHVFSSRMRLVVSNKKLLRCL